MDCINEYMLFRVYPCLYDVIRNVCMQKKVLDQQITNESLQADVTYCKDSEVC
jgi:hypothetical protein